MSKVIVPPITSASDAATPAKPAAPAAAEISCFDLMRMLLAVYHERSELDVAIVRMPETESLAVNTMKRSFRALEERISAIHWLVIETPARTLPDAAGQLLVAYDYLADNDDRFVSGAARGIFSAFCAVVQAAGIDPDNLGFRHLAPYDARPSAT